LSLTANQMSLKFEVVLFGNILSDFYICNQSLVEYGERSIKFTKINK
jgi:hypothetical protein